MEDYKNEAKEFFESLTKEEFVELLEGAGFKVVDAVDGKGGVIFTDEIKKGVQKHEKRKSKSAKNS